VCQKEGVRKTPNVPICSGNGKALQFAVLARSGLSRSGVVDADNFQRPAGIGGTPVSSCDNQRAPQPVELIAPQR
jgi:hypothetical protein